MSTIVKINTATLFLWQHELLCAGMYGSSDESPRTPPWLDAHPRHICVWGYTAQLQKEILTLKSLFKWSHSMRRALHRLRKSRNTVKRERVVRTDCLWTCRPRLSFPRLCSRWKWAFLLCGIKLYGIRQSQCHAVFKLCLAASVYPVPLSFTPIC